MYRIALVKVIWIVCFVLLCASSIVWAQDNYRFEATGVYASSKNENYNVDAYLGGLTYHFKPVNTEGHPLAEAAFMERVGGVSIKAARNEITYDGSADSSNSDGSAYSAILSYAMPNQIFTGYAAYSISKSEYGSSPDLDESSSDYYRLGAGAYITDGLTVMFYYDHAKIDLSMRTSSFSQEDFYQEMLSLDGKWVKELQNGKAINVMGVISRTNYTGGGYSYDVDTGAGTLHVESAGRDDVNMQYKLSSDYYITSGVGFGASIALDDGDSKSLEGETYGIRSRVFIGQKFSIDGLYEHFSARNDIGANSDSYQIGLSMRF